jgi:tRNA 2-selenouridine synthase
MAHIFAKIGWSVAQLDGGYKSYRHFVNHSLSTEATQFNWRVLCGPTGSGKSRLLQSLQGIGAQVLDLEQMAGHRGSVLGAIPNCPQPSQKQFESRIFEQLQKFDHQKVIYVEAESKKIGKLRVPEILMDRMRASPCISICLHVEKRVDLLLQEYVHFIADTASLNLQLDFLTSLHGKEKIATWRQLAESGHISILVKQLLEQHYDPAYNKSIERNFTFVNKAKIIELSTIAQEDFIETARLIMNQV